MIAARRSGKRDLCQNNDSASALSDFSTLAFIGDAFFFFRRAEEIFQPARVVAAFWLTRALRGRGE
jgi:hypothetical protein